MHLRGGDLEIDWRADDHVYMTGAATEIFSAEIDREMIERAAARSTEPDAGDRVREAG